MGTVKEWTELSPGLGDVVGDGRGGELWRSPSSLSFAIVPPPISPHLPSLYTSLASLRPPNFPLFLGLTKLVCVREASDG